MNQQSLKKYYYKVTEAIMKNIFIVFIPSRLWMALALWLGLGRKPEERPEVDEGEREGAALLLGVLRGLLEVEQPRARSCRTIGWLLTCHNKKKKKRSIFLQPPIWD